jgi:hypothetical protein
MWDIDAGKLAHNIETLFKYLQENGLTIDEVFNP